jgi:hypothetical protein
MLNRHHWRAPFGENRAFGRRVRAGLGADWVEPRTRARTRAERSRDQTVNDN